MKGNELLRKLRARGYHLKEGFDAGVLQPHPVLERTEVVPDVQPAGGAVPRQQPESGRIRGNLRLNFAAAFL